MPLMLDDMRAEFARFLAEDPKGRFRMDAALAHVVALAYRAGMDAGLRAREEAQAAFAPAARLLVNTDSRTP